MKKCMALIVSVVLLVPAVTVYAMDSDTDEKKEGEYVRQEMQLTSQEQEALNRALWKAASTRQQAFKLIFSHNKRVCVDGVDKARKVLEQGAQIDAQDENGRTALMSAVSFQNWSIATMLLDAGADINIQDKDGYAALHYATLSGSEKVVELLIERRATIDVVNRLGNTPLRDAIVGESVDMVRMLLCAGADPDLKNKQGKKIVNKACYSFMPDIFTEVANKRAELWGELAVLKNIMCRKILEEQIKTRDIVEIVVDYAVPYCEEQKYRLLNSFFVEPAWVYMKKELEKKLSQKFKWYSKLCDCVVS